MFDQFGSSSASNYGTDANFQANYRLTNAFLHAHANPFLIDNRVWISGYLFFPHEVADFDAVLTATGIPHTSRPSNAKTPSRVGRAAGFLRLSAGCIKTALIWVTSRARVPGEVIMAKAGTRIGLLHHMGGGNLGDDGTLDAVLQNIRSRWPDSEIVGLSMNPDDTHKRHGIVSYPIRQRTWNLGNTSVNHGTNIKQRAKAALSKYPSVLKLVKALNAVVRRNTHQRLQGNAISRAGDSPD